MRSRCRSIVWIVLFALTAADAAFAQVSVAPRTIKKLEPAKRETGFADLQLPPYSDRLLEITAERLTSLERTVNAFADPASQKARRDQAVAKRQEWERCLASASASGDVKSAPAPAQPPQDNTAALQKLATEYVQKIQNAKTVEEKSKLGQEFAAKQQALLAPAMQAGAAQASANQASGAQLRSKCGEMPDVPSESEAAQIKLDKPMWLMVDRVFGFCKAQSTWYVAKDGAVSSTNTPYRDDDKGSMWYNIEVYSPAEGKVLNERCATIIPVLEARGLKYWARPE
jgi:hypothetical protein